MIDDRPLIASLLGAAMFVLVVLVLAPAVMPMPEQTATSSTDNPRSPVMATADL